jgi:hypothetical protein
MGEATEDVHLRIADKSEFAGSMQFAYLYVVLFTV